MINRIWWHNRYRIYKYDIEQISKKKKKKYMYLYVIHIVLFIVLVVSYFISGMFDLGRILNSNFNLFYIENLILNQTCIE